MIKVSKYPKKIGSVAKFNRSEMNGLKMVNNIISVKLKAPKNTLKMTKHNFNVGYEGDDFVKDLVTVIHSCFIYTFKRTNRKRRKSK